MSKSRVDAEHRIELPGSQPGDVFEVRPHGEGRFLLIRQDQPIAPRNKKTREECLEAIRNSPLSFNMTWEELREITREP